MVPSLPDENSPRYEGWAVVAASSTGVFCAGLLVYVFAVLLGPITGEFGWSRQSVSAAYSTMAIVSAVCAPALGVLLDRFGPRMVALPCLALCGAGIASLSALTASRAHLYGVFAVMGVAGIGTSALAYSRAVSTWFDARRGFALALVISGGALGSISHPAATDALVRAIGWRQACLVLGGSILGIGLPVVAAFVRERGATRSAASAETAGTSAVAALRSWWLWVLLLVIGAATIASNGIIVHLPSLLTDRGFSPQRGALSLSAIGIASLAGRLLTGWLVDRFRATTVSFFLLLTATAGIVLLSRSSGAELIAVVLIGFGLGGELDITPFLLTRYFGLRAVSTLYGLTWTTMGIAGAIGPILMGRTFDRTGSYDALLQWLAIATLTAATLMLTLPVRTLRTRKQPVSAAVRSPHSTRNPS
jgi:predicted MFS family arabinose efflux permease